MSAAGFAVSIDGREPVVKGQHGTVQTREYLGRTRRLRSTSVSGIPWDVHMCTHQEDVSVCGG